LTATFRVELRPSRTLATLVIAGHLAASASVWLVLQPVAAATATAGLCLSLAGLFRLWARQPAALVVGPGMRLEIVNRAGEVRPASLVAARVPVWWLVVLRFTGPAGRNETLCLLSDSADAESLRRLRAWMLGPRPRDPASPEAGNGAGETKDPRTA